jgi:hypothetical protein
VAAAEEALRPEQALPVETVVFQVVVVVPEAARQMAIIRAPVVLGEMALFAFIGFKETV